MFLFLSCSKNKTGYNNNTPEGDKTYSKSSNIIFNKRKNNISDSILNYFNKYFSNNIDFDKIDSENQILRMYSLLFSIDSLFPRINGTNIDSSFIWGSGSVNSHIDLKFSVERNYFDNTFFTKRLKLLYIIDLISKNNISSLERSKHTTKTILTHWTILDKNDNKSFYYWDVIKYDSSYKYFLPPAVLEIDSLYFNYYEEIKKRGLKTLQKNHVYPLSNSRFKWELLR